MGPKCDQVFDTLELLELILLQLPMRDLLLAQRVCQQFRILIRTSPALQQALFFRPISQTAASKATSPTPNLLSSQTGEPVTESWKQNPLLVQAFWPWFNRSKRNSLFFSTGHEIFETLPLAHPSARFAFLRAEASWRRMLVVQPPVTQLELLRVHSALGGGSIDDAILCLGNGLTMGILYDITCQEVLGRTRSARTAFRMQWHGGEQRLVLVVKLIYQCVVNFDPSVEDKAKSYFSGACEGKLISWKRRSIGNSPQARRNPPDISYVGDFEAE